MELKDILEQHAGAVMDRQQVLGERLGSHEWAADTESGMIFFSGPNIESPFEIIGTVSSATGEWLWGWANASLPGDLAVISDSLHAVGKAEGIDFFTKERFPATKDDLHAMGIAACGLGGAKGYYIADYGDGILLVALKDESVLHGWQPEHSRIFSVFPRVIQLFDLDHKAALQHYLTSLGYAVSEEGGLSAVKDGRIVTATFDTQGRLAELQNG
ncbi:conserved hypothetical protein [uncultured delta proteobacterium]|uniref:Uncharacterized protein n=1 Tax=uncultured delta proteobacterium TaxID=34034 RepID=A0A212K419_9DELT|nr:conserved hypothetical protein [uncultured delta proteobacterium]